MLITPEFVENFMKLGVAAVAFTLLLFIIMNIIDRFMQRDVMCLNDSAKVSNE